MAYWDTSCILKLYCREKDSEVYLQRVSKLTQPLLSSVLLETELFFALQQKEFRQEIKPGAADPLFKQFQRDVSMGRIQLLPFGEDICEEAIRIAKICYSHTPIVPLRTLDGLHLATAKISGTREILTTDRRMILAAAICELMAECK